MSEESRIRAYAALPEYRKALGLPPEVTEQYEMLAQGEYNRNYLFTHPVTRQKLLFRVNFGSQMHLEDQIGYEYQALALLEPSGRTPRPLYVDGSLAHLPYGVMVMEFLPGHVLDYHTELPFAAECMADIHSLEVSPDTHLIAPENQLRAILEECEEMFAVYESSSAGDGAKKRQIRRMLDLVWKKADALSPPSYRCCINTELNSTNFLINGAGKGNYLIDWEKPLYGEPAQDLGHFLAPTTTFWKTDVILTKKEMKSFVEKYINCVAGRFDTENLMERTMVYIPVTCLRGITWCAMAWIQYQDPDRKITNASTARKLEEYLSTEFLDRIEQNDIA
ncbi:aminoglycoside phosphotransferase family protein [uncultured Merdimonas sp.]|uniref:aminoglycoside phosphotransferase family protein n=1 Tax=uncultured Merdimonas sp. TaxID=2023269 RepID=UPI003207F3F8